MSGFSVAYDAALVEKAVLLAERTLDAAGRARFRAERDRLYGTVDPEEREARFEELHGRWFQRLGLDRPLHDALAERPGLTAATSGCFVTPARSAKDEMADLNDRPGTGSGPAIHVRVRPEALLAAGPLATFLRRELEHVADMIDPAFGYRRELPPSAAGPALDNLRRERYRAVWDTTVDGRLFHRGLLAEGEREARQADFARLFPMLEGGPEEHFRRFFDSPSPTHAAIVAFVLDPPGPAAGDGRCPLCAFPTPKLDPHPERVPAPALREMERAHPAWRTGQGFCAQCADLLIAGAARG